MNPILWDTHSDVFRALSLTKGNPRGHILESPYQADTAENESHETTDETTVSPAGGLEGRPEVATETAFARLAVVQEKTVGAAHPIVMEVVDDRHLEIEGSLINGGRETGKDIVDLPKIKVTDLLIFTKPVRDGQVVVSVQGGPDFGLHVRAQEIFG